jgi:hypothetical protein
VPRQAAERRDPRQYFRTLSIARLGIAPTTFRLFCADPVDLLANLMTMIDLAERGMSCGRA